LRQAYATGRINQVAISTHSIIAGIQIRKDPKRPRID